MNYMTLVGFSRRDEWHVYTYECEPGTCEKETNRTLLELPAELDLFSRRHPECGGS
jgi:hypothetical protein